jgi:hypothetical protein
MDEVFERRNANVGVGRTAVQSAVGRVAPCAIKVASARRARTLIQDNSEAGDVMRAGLMFACETAGKNAIGAIASAAPG